MSNKIKPALYALWAIVYKLSIFPLEAIAWIVGVFLTGVLIALDKTEIVDNPEEEATHPEGWKLEIFPQKWMTLYNNYDNGMQGDSRWWRSLAEQGKSPLSKWQKFVWTNFRNPANGFRWIDPIFSYYAQNVGLPEYVGDYYISDKYGIEGFRIIWVKTKSFPYLYSGIYYVKVYNRNAKVGSFWYGRYFVARIGFKTSPDHTPENRTSPVGSVFRIWPFDKHDGAE